MTIRNKADWIETARYVVPLLPAYMAEESGQADRPSIHRHPFGQLCDLCSEDWALLDDVESQSA